MRSFRCIRRVLVGPLLTLLVAGPACQSPPAGSGDPSRTPNESVRYVPPPAGDEGPPSGEAPTRRAAAPLRSDRPAAAPADSGGQTRSASVASVPELEARLSGIVAQQESVHFVSNIETQVEGDGYTMHQFADLTVEHLRTQDGWRSRMESRTRSVQSVGGESDVRESAELKIYDGRFIYSMETTRDGTAATRAARDPQRDVSPFDMRASLAQMRQFFDIRVLPDEDVEGQPAWVIEMTPRRPGDLPTVSRMLQFYSKDSAVNLKVVMYDAQGRPYMTLRTRDVRINEPIAMERFTFTPPPGVEVRDTGPGATTESADEPATDPANEAGTRQRPAIDGGGDEPARTEPAATDGATPPDAARGESPATAPAP